MTTNDVPYSDRIEVPSLPFDEEGWREDLAAIEEGYPRGIRPETLHAHEQRLKAYYRPDTPPREFLGYGVLIEDRERLPWSQVKRIHLRVMARSGFEANRAFRAYLGEGYAVSAWNEIEQQMRR